MPKKVATAAEAPAKPAKRAPAKAVEVVKERPEPHLREPQLRILNCLATSGKAMSRKDIAEEAQVNLADCSAWIGSVKEEVRDAMEEKYNIRSLVSWGYVTHEINDIDGKDVTCHVITKQGKLALQKAIKEGASLEPSNRGRKKAEPEPEPEPVKPAARNRKAAPAAATTTKVAANGPAKPRPGRVKTTKPTPQAEEVEQEAEES